AQQQGGRGVGVDEDLLQRRHRGLRGLHDLTDVVQDDLQALRQRLVGGHHDGAAGDVGKVGAPNIDDPVAGAPQARIDAEDAHQWRKCRTPVSTMAMPRSSAAAMTSSSRTLPPGRMTQVAPASATTPRPSRTGKKASDATAEPARPRPAGPALIEARRAGPRRRTRPAPTPTVMPCAANIMALDLTYLATCQANIRSCICCSVGALAVTTLRPAGVSWWLSGVWTSQPPPTRLTSKALAPRPAGICSTRTFFLAAKTSSASAS